MNCATYVTVVATYFWKIVLVPYWKWPNYPIGCVLPLGVYSRGCARAWGHECVLVRVPLCVRRVRVCMLVFHYEIVSHVAISLHHGIICELPFQLFSKISPCAHPVLSLTPRSQRLWRRLSMPSSSWLSSFGGSAEGATSDAISVESSISSVPSNDSFNWRWHGVL